MLIYSITLILLSCLKNSCYRLLLLLLLLSLLRLLHHHHLLLLLLLTLESMMDLSFFQKCPPLFSVLLLTSPVPQSRAL